MKGRQLTDNIDLVLARKAWEEAGKALDTADFAPPEGTYTWRPRLAGALNTLVAATGLMPSPAARDIAPPSPEPESTLLPHARALLRIQTIGGPAWERQMLHADNLLGLGYCRIPRAECLLINDMRLLDEHCRIILDREGTRTHATLRAFGETRINNREMAQIENLYSGDVITIGETRIVFFLAEPRRAPRSDNATSGTHTIIAPGSTPARNPEP